MPMTGSSRHFAEATKIGELENGWLEITQTEMNER